MVSGCFAGDTVSDLFRIQGTLNQYGYHSILQRYAIPSGLHLVGLSFVFQFEMVWDELDHRVKEKQPQVLSICGNSFKTVGKAFQVKLVERMPSVCKAVIKAKGGYFEESQI